jgi:hypothetical protein
MARQPFYNIANVVGHGIERDTNSPTFGRHRLKLQKLVCSNCNALMFFEEKVSGPTNDPVFSLCCSKKKFLLPPIPPLPPLIADLIKQENELSISFMERIRSYNSIFAFTSFNAKVSYI